MPIYEYVCKDCHNHFEKLVSSANSTETIKCPECGSLKVKKTISAACFRMGSGGPTISKGALSGCASKSGFS